MFYKQFESLCKDNATTPTRFTKEVLGLSSSKITAWKNGSIPKYETLQAIADYFNVSVGYLFDGEQTKSSFSKLTKNEQEILYYFSKLNSEQQLKLIGRAEALADQSTHISKGRNTSPMNNTNKYEKIFDLVEEMRKYASLILQNADQTYNHIFPEKHDVQKIKDCLLFDKSLIDEAKSFYNNNYDELARNEIEDFFNECYAYINSIEHLVQSKKMADISEAKSNCSLCLSNLISCTKNTVLEDKEVLSELTTPMERSIIATNKAFSNSEKAIARSSKSSCLEIPTDETEKNFEEIKPNPDF